VPGTRLTQGGPLSPKVIDHLQDAVELDLLRKSGEFFVMKEDLDDQAEAANEGI
jgi:hypothetical protein